MNNMTYSASETFFFNSISILVKRPNFPLVFLKAAFHANPGAVKNKQSQVQIFQDTYS